MSGGTVSGADAKWDLISRNLQEHIGEDEIKEILKKRDLVVRHDPLTA